MPEAAQRDLLKKEEQRKKLGVTMARLDQKILEFTAAAAGALGFRGGRRRGRSSWRGQAHLAEAARGARARSGLGQAAVSQITDAARGTRRLRRLAPMDVEPAGRRPRRASGC